MAPFRLVAMVMVLTLTGGAQACLALCAAPAQPAAKTSCHHCPHKAPKDKPATPCKQCQTATQDRLATERDHSILKTSLELTFLPVVELTPLTPTLDRSVETTHSPAHGPPGDRLHQFCLLLI